MPWPASWDRGHVHGAIAEATGVVLHADDPLPDMLIVEAQELGLTPMELRMWIYNDLDGTDIRAVRYATLLTAVERWANKLAALQEGVEPRTKGAQQP